MVYFSPKQVKEGFYSQCQMLPYPVFVGVVICEDVDKRNEFLAYALRNSGWTKTEIFEKFSEDGKGSIYATLVSNQVAIVMDRWDDGYFMHELHHAIYWLGESIGEPISVHNIEAQAYMFQYLYDYFKLKSNWNKIDDELKDK